MKDEDIQKLIRQDIYEVIDGERDYQDMKWGPQHDAGHEIASWILYMQHHLNKAAAIASTEAPESGALDCLRKVVALGIACFEVHGVPKRED